MIIQPYKSIMVHYNTVLILHGQSFMPIMLCLGEYVCVAGLSFAGQLGDNLVTSQAESSLLSSTDSRAVRHILHLRQPE